MNSFKDGYLKTLEALSKTITLSSNN